MFLAITHPMLQVQGVVRRKAPIIGHVHDNTEQGWHSPHTLLIVIPIIGFLLEAICTFLKRLLCDLHEQPTVCQCGVLSTTGQRIQNSKVVANYDTLSKRS